MHPTPAPTLILERQAYEILLDWLGETREAVECVVAHSGLRVSVRVEPYRLIPIVVPFTECERDIMAAIHSAGRPLTRTKIIKVLAREGKFHGESTIARALAGLVKRRHLVNEGRQSGYRLTSGEAQT